MGLLGEPPTKKMAVKFCVAFFLLALLQLFCLMFAAKFSVNDTYILWNKVNTL